MSILKDIKTKNRKKAWKTILAVSMLAALAGGYYFNRSKDAKEEFKTYEVKRGDLTSSLTSDGKVLYKEQYDLNFPTAGTLSKILKKEGDDVKKGDIIAKLDDSYLKLNLDKAYIALDNATANLNAKLATKGQPGDISISQAQLETSKTTLDTNITQGKQEVMAAEDNVASAQKDYDNAVANLDVMISQENLNIRNSQEKAFTDIDAAVPMIDKYINDADIILGITDLNKIQNDSYEIFLGAKNPQTRASAERSLSFAYSGFNAFKGVWATYKQNPDYSKISDHIMMISLSDEQTYDALADTIEMLQNSIATSNFTQATIDGYIANLKTDINSLEAQMQKITLSRQGIDNAELSLKTKTETQQNNIDSLGIKVKLAQNALQSAKTKLNNNIDIANSQIGVSEANLEFKKDQIDKRELEPFQVAIDNARKGIEEAKKRLDDATLKSPIDGKIGKMSITKIGTLISANPANPFVTIINKDSLYVEAKIEEGDIPNIRLGQNVKLTFNSLENISLDGKVSYISDKAETDVNNIVTYKVEILFDGRDSGVKEGFTTQIAFELVKKENVLIVPFETIREEGGESSVMLPDKQKRVIKTGISDGEHIEVVEGLKQGDVIRY